MSWSEQHHDTKRAVLNGDGLLLQFLRQKLYRRVHYDPMEGSDPSGNHGLKRSGEGSLKGADTESGMKVGV
jgi:hypothetical protein